MSEEVYGLLAFILLSLLTIPFIIIKVTNKTYIRPIPEGYQPRGNKIPPIPKTGSAVKPAVKTIKIEVNNENIL